MLSRVAAVKAPRTHNRRRVTGSSGRRREGGESEPRRPNMSRRVFASAVLLLLVFLMMCCGSGAAQVVVEEPSSDPQFEWKDIKDGDGVTVESLGAPSLLKVGSDVFAVAEVQCKKSGENDVFTGIASQIITTQTANTPVEALKDYKDKKQFLEDGSEDPKKKVDVSRPTTVVKGSDIYMLLGKYSRSSSDIPEEDDAGNWGLLLVRGEVGGKAGNKQIDWKETTDSSRAYFGKELQPLKRLIGGGGSGVKMNDGTLVFPVEATKKKKEKDEKTISLIIHNLAATPSWKLSKGMSADDCSDPSVVEWKDKKLMMMTACDGRRRVYESADKGDSWTEELGTLSRVWGSKKGVRSGFITARIDGDGDDNRNVMLVTLPVYAKTESEEKEKEKEKGELHLWLTDNTHIADIGAVSVEGDDVAASSLLYKSGKSGESETNGKEELIALYEKKGGGDTPSLGMVSVPLTAQLQRVKEVLKTWNKVDSRVSHLCPSESALQDPSADTACSAVKITDGLVGFLSGSFSDSTWRDEYLGVNAKMKGNDVGKAAAESTRTSDGVTFHGAWAEWPVGAQGENQLYHFANYKFTLVATVSIDKVPEGHTPIPLMGVQMNYNENTVLLGLSYNNNKEKKWMLQCGGGTKSEELSRTGEPGTKRHVVILLRNGNQGTAYVDGQRVGAQCALGSTETQEISHFYIGGDGRSAVGQGDVSVTVTNVLLYNRPLSSKEITALDTIKLSISQTAKEGETEEGTALDGGAHGDASNHCGSGLLPSLLLLLGLWWFAAL
ncbi:trans-sialidase [Trypanosoma cruzi Dm28c]|uniref:Trans-sialidase n=2 Tax=Trypanosoma cruzi TaxID=5693 RepID=V5D1E2_TRYCR|nr:trans-sialidase [Trypanosoma cruzi Dm28c]PBJ79319.1 trans-sialidase [Trypanosoma cruzi cruzi]PWU92209.1 putative trans-sialidase, Group V [Trypanosoma cruzi]